MVAGGDTGTDDGADDGENGDVRGRADVDATDEEGMAATEGRDGRAEDETG